MRAKWYNFASFPEEVDVCSPKAQPKGPILKDAGAVLSMVDALKREDYAIGVIAVALGVEAVRAAGRVSLPGTDGNCKLPRAHMTPVWSAVQSFMILRRNDP